MHAALYPLVKFGDFFYLARKKKAEEEKNVGHWVAFQEKEEKELNQVLHKDRKRPANARKALSLFFMHGKLVEKREEGNLKGEQESRFPPTNHKMAARHENRKTFPNRKTYKTKQFFALICHPLLLLVLLF